ncbi:unnamed protein product [Zymoseptoria tritici ST99CH_1A5]|uniref:Uncharacterized protein n=1 Tax=Zymoseptoria tritici ST99CH_1A5 TaxID=1276529 RepID=A0A1Y6LPE9_ZYMTR|nr:unnamed protein product [Zymoseptoria tritici ST99CH_1A5]
MAAAVANPVVVDTSMRPSRPAFLSARTRTISYKRQNGNVVTLDLHKDSKAAESLRELAKKNPTTEQDKKFLAQVESGEPAQGLVAGVYDALSIWIMDAIEIAMFGPYDEPK